ncbi:MAG: hypothetical protein JJLCMIEE_01913 [Acidimicrobiales bacterium]|nr:MAG: hypothetical protein EDR02_10420 [Actinomycetota bacterium]MBV6508847.1 hypothetical protein [Acidimicrobiales bacterium]RIK04973.1 MAG: hypothetical protein DCC48_11520 [Acidobacteriota bacterium]
MHPLEHLDAYQVTIARGSGSATTGLWPALAAAAMEGQPPRIDSLPAELYEDDLERDEPGMFDYDLQEAVSQRLEPRAEDDDLALVFSIDDYRRLRRATAD